jgi:hypothetical protein
MIDSLASSCSLERGVFPVLARGGKLLGAPRDGYFIDTGVPESIGAAKAAVKSLNDAASLWSSLPIRPGSPEGSIRKTMCWLCMRRSPPSSRCRARTSTTSVTARFTLNSDWRKPARGIACWLPTPPGKAEIDKFQRMWLDYGESMAHVGFVVERANRRKLANRLQPKRVIL